jgi:acyl-CoA dehydrogenase
MSPHPLASLRFDNCRVATSQCLGEVNAGFKLAMRTLDIFRASVAGAAIGMGRRALHEAISYSRQRRMFGGHLADFQLTQARLGEMSSLLESAALLTYRAAWLRDTHGSDGDAAIAYTRAAAMAKSVATENASRLIDMALQMHGGTGVLVGHTLESLYRDIRALRIYEGATEVQQLIIGKSLLKSAA